MWCFRDFLFLQDHMKTRTGVSNIRDEREDEQTEILTQEFITNIIKTSDIVMRNRLNRQLIQSQTNLIINILNFYTLTTCVTTRSTILHPSVNSVYRYQHGERNKCIDKMLLEVQQRREDHKIIKLSSVRVVHGSRKFYGKLEITKNVLLIKPHDKSILNIHIEAHHMKGFHEVDSRAILLNMYSQEIVIHFRMDRQMARGLKRIRELTGSESTSESSGSDRPSTSTL